MGNFVITPERATDLAQAFHNDTEENSRINQDKIISALVEQLGEELGDWLEDNIDWDGILDDDHDLREFIYEREDARKGEY